MIRIQFGERTFGYDEKAPLSMGDVVAMREMGVDPERWASMVDRIKVGKDDVLRTADAMELAETMIQFAYLAGVRQDHNLSWREFIWSVPIDDFRGFETSDAPEPPADAIGPKVRKTRAAKSATAPASA